METAAVERERGVETVEMSSGGGGGEEQMVKKVETESTCVLEVLSLQSCIGNLGERDLL